MPDDLTAQVMAAQQDRQRQLIVDSYLANEERLRTEDQAEEQPAETEGRSFAADVGRGIIEAPRQVLGGVRDAVQSTLDLTFDWGKDIEEAFPAMKVGVNFDLDPETPIFDRDTATENQMVLPEVKQPESVTGGLVRGVSQFVTGFLGARKALAPIQAVGRTAQFGKAMLTGAIADFTVFDEHQERLANLVQEFPALQNPVTEYLAADPTDGVMEGRFKNAIEGLGLGVAADGFVRVVRALRSATAARTAARAAGIPEVPPEIARENVLAPLGDVDSPLLGPRQVNPAPPLIDDAMAATEPGVPLDVAARGLNEPVYPLQTGTGTDEVFVNFARIEGEDDLMNVMGQMADAMAPQIDEARRGVQSFEETARLADDMGMDVGDLMERTKGQPLNAEQALAARRIWAQSGESLANVARVASESPTEANLFAFRRMMAVHHAIQTQVIAARTETARALSSWRIPAGGNMETARAIDNAFEALGGTTDRGIEVTRELAKRIAATGNDPRALGDIVKRTMWARTRDAVIEGWVMGLLSGPKTHMVNALSNTSVMFQQIQERATAARISQLLGDDAGVQLGEATAMMTGAISGQWDAMRFAWRAFRTGETGFGTGKIDLPRQGSISREGLGITSNSWLAKSVDYIGMGARIPGRLLSTGDEYFKTIGYRMELNAQAVRQASQEVNAGSIPADQYRARVVELREAPPENIRMASMDAALYSTFTNKPGKFGQWVSRGTNEFPLLRFLIPFVRTPANITHYTMQRTPLAPLFKEVRADIAAGGARRDVALSRMATGSSLMLLSMDLAMDGSITGAGPQSPGEMDNLRRQGWQPYSIKVGDRYFAYNRLDPIGMTLGLGADFTEISMNGEWGEEDLDEAHELTAAIIGSIGSNLTSKTYLRGMSEFFEFMAAPNMFGENYVKGFAGTLIPTGVAEIARIQDPYMRAAGDMMSTFRRRMPGLSQDLPAVRDLWGRPVDFRSGLGQTFDTVSPVYSSSHDPEPVDLELQRLEYFPRKAPFRLTFNGVSVNLENYPHAFSRLHELAGNELKHPLFGDGAMDTLNRLVSGRHEYSGTYAMATDGPDGGKAEMIRAILLDYREQAKQQILQEFPDIRRLVDQGLEEQRNRR